MAYFHLNGSSSGGTWPLYTVANQIVWQGGAPPIPPRTGSNIIQRVGSGAWEYLMLGLPHPDSVAAAPPPPPPAPAPTAAPAPAPAPARATQVYVAGDVGAAQGATYIPVTRKTPEAVKEGGGGVLVALAAAAALFFSGT